MAKPSRIADRLCAPAPDRGDRFGCGAAGRLLVRRAELAGHARHRRARQGLVHHHRRTARRGDAAAELAGDGRRRHRRQRVRHRGHAAARRHVLRRGQAVARRRRATCRPTRRRRSPRPRCSGHSTSNSPRPADEARAGQAERRLQHPGRAAPAATRPPRRCCPRWAWWSTRAISVRCRTSPTRPMPRSRAGTGSFDGLMPRLAELTASLDQQTDDIIAAADGLNRFAGILARSKDSLGAHAGHPARGAEGAQRQPRPTSSTRSRRCGRSPESPPTCWPRPRTTSPPTSRTSTRSIKALNDNADDFITDLEFLPTFPFHYKYLRNAVRGDYLNVFVTFDLTLRRTRRDGVHHVEGARPEHEAPERGRQPAGLPDRRHGQPVRAGRRPVQDPAGHGDPARRGRADAGPV